MRRVLTGLALGILLALVAVPAFAQEGRGNEAIIGRNLTVRSGEVREGDLFIAGGRLVVERGGRVVGDVAIVGGDVSVAGEIRGDLAAFGGRVSLQDGAVVDGDLMVMGGTLNQAPGAVIRGQVLENFNPRRAVRNSQDQIVPAPRPLFQNRTPLDWLLAIAFWVLRAILTSIVLAVLGVLVVMLLPQPIRAVTQTAQAAPLPSFLVGFGTIVVVPFALVALALLSTVLILVCIGLLGFPLIAILALSFLVLLVFGWIAVGLLLGEKIFEFLQIRESLPLAAVIVGVVLITLLASIPWLGWLFILVFGSLGLGAVLLSRFGTQTREAGWPWTSPPHGPWPPEPATPPVPNVTRGQWVPAEPPSSPSPEPAAGMDPAVDPGSETPDRA